MGDADRGTVSQGVSCDRIVAHSYGTQGENGGNRNGFFGWEYQLNLPKQADN